MNTGEILRAAAARVRKGWRQGDYGFLYSTMSGYGRQTCAVGAVCAIAGIHPNEIGSFENGPVVAFLEKALALPAGHHVTHWNDASGQTAENVAAGLELAALIWDQEQAIGVDGWQVEAVPVCTTK